MNHVAGLRIKPSISWCQQVMAIFKDFVVAMIVGVTAFVAVIGALFAFMKLVILISWLIDSLFAALS
jgi:hypothetical protein